MAYAYSDGMGLGNVWPSVSNGALRFVALFIILSLFLSLFLHSKLTLVLSSLPLLYQQCFWTDLPRRSLQVPLKRLSHSSQHTQTNAPGPSPPSDPSFPPLLPFGHQTLHSLNPHRPNSDSPSPHPTYLNDLYYLLPISLRSLSLSLWVFFRRASRVFSSLPSRSLWASFCERALFFLGT